MHGSLCHLCPDKPRKAVILTWAGCGSIQPVVVKPTLDQASGANIKPTFQAARSVLLPSRRKSLGATRPRIAGSPIRGAVWDCPRTDPGVIGRARVEARHAVRLEDCAFVPRISFITTSITIR